MWGVHMINKKIILLVLIVTLIITISPLNATNAAVTTDRQMYYESSVVENIAYGVVHENMVRFDKNGWQNINIIRVDMTNPYIKIDAITNSESLFVTDTTSSLAKSKGAVAAINASFFNPMLSPGNASTIGPVVESGKIISANYDFNRDNNSMATFSIDNLNNILIDYWKTDMSIKTSDGKFFPVNRYNKPYYGYKDFTVLDRNWGLYSIGTAGSDFIEMVVDKGVVVEIRKYMPAVQIPENGYVVVTKKAGISLINNNFRVGDRIVFDIKSNINLKSIDTAVTGGCILLENGIIPPKFSHDVPGVHPRTAIGSSKDGKEVIMVTVDGRQEGSRGMTLTELAGLMAELGAYNALNLDGGGSTTMVARKTGTTELNVVNKPSDTVQRRIPTAIGIKSTAPVSRLDKLIISSDDNKVFVNTSRDFTVTGIDMYYNPVDIGFYKVRWDITGVEGYFIDNTFYPTGSGKGKITATIGNIQTETEIMVLDNLVRLIPAATILLSEGETINLPNITGVDINGYKAIINAKDAIWTDSMNLVRESGDKVTSYNAGNGYMTVSVGNVKTHIETKVAARNATIINDFESVGKSVKNMVYTTAVKFSGSSSGMLFYHFRNNTENHAFSAEFPDDGIKIEKNVSRLGIRVFNNMRNTNRLSAELIDSNGRKHIIELSKSLDWTGWRYVEATIDHIALPAQLKAISVINTEGNVNSGILYLDDLTSISLVYLKNRVVLPSDVILSDNVYKQNDFDKPVGSMNFAVVGQSTLNNDSLQKLNPFGFVKTVNQNYEAAFIGNGTLNEILSKEIFTHNSQQAYMVWYYDNNMFIKLDTSNKTLTNTSQQWSRLIETLENSVSDNVFIFMSEPLSSFIDKQEAKLLQKIFEDYRMKKYKNMWIFNDGTDHTVDIRNGVRYVRVSRINDSNSSGAEYILVTVNNDEISYSLRKISGLK